jgi:hypothetical protein
MEINHLKRVALSGKKSRESLIGKKVRFIGSDINKQIESNGVYTISNISSGNYDSFIYLEELPTERYSEYSRKIVPNCFDIENFKLV